MTFSGWDPASEDWSYLDSMPTGLGFIDIEPMPKAVKPPREWLKVERQVRNDCQGNALTSGMEVCYYNATGEIVQLSRHMAYIASQKLTGGGGCADSGSHIAAGVELALEYGVCLESVYPYPSRFTCALTSQQIEAGRPYRIAESRRLQNPEEVRDWLISGKGAVHAGVRWGGGYHAIEYLQATDRGVDFVNSWGESWDGDGWGEDSMGDIKQRFNDRYAVFIGISGVKEKPVFDWLGDGGGMAG